MKIRIVSFTATFILLFWALALSQESLREVYPGDDFIVHEEMIPMRDGVTLFTVILTPKNVKGWR